MDEIIKLLESKIDENGEINLDKAQSEFLISFLKACFRIIKQQNIIVDKMANL